MCIAYCTTLWKFSKTVSHLVWQHLKFCQYNESHNDNSWTKPQSILVGPSQNLSVRIVRLTIFMRSVYLLNRYSVIYYICILNCISRFCSCVEHCLSQRVHRLTMANYYNCYILLSHISCVIYIIYIMCHIYDVSYISYISCFIYIMFHMYH